MEHYIIDGPMDFLERDYTVISLVGGGGKTTTMFALAEHYCRLGKRVLVTTTTHIGKPDQYYASDKKEVLQLWEQGHYAVVGRQEKKAGFPDKLKSLPEPEMERYMELADMVLIEADGAKCLPCKIPNQTEPVIPAACDLVIGVMGMSAWNQPVKTHCFRWEQVSSDLTERFVDSDRITTEMMAEILSSPNGTKKDAGTRDYHVILNQCDTPERIRAAEEIREKLSQRGIRQVSLTCYKEIQGNL